MNSFGDLKDEVGTYTLILPLTCFPMNSFTLWQLKVAHSEQVTPFLLPKLEMVANVVLVKTPTGQTFLAHWRHVG